MDHKNSKLISRKHAWRIARKHVALKDVEVAYIARATGVKIEFDAVDVSVGKVGETLAVFHAPHLAYVLEPSDFSPFYG
jgi:hypothetical protein